MWAGNVNINIIFCSILCWNSGGVCACWSPKQSWCDWTYQQGSLFAKIRLMKFRFEDLQVRLSNQRSRVFVWNASCADTLGLHIRRYCCSCRTVVWWPVVMVRKCNNCYSIRSWSFEHLLACSHFFIKNEALEVCCGAFDMAGDGCGIFVF